MLIASVAAAAPRKARNMEADATEERQEVIVEGRVRDIAEGAFMLDFGRGQILIRVPRGAIIAGDQRFEPGDWVRVRGPAVLMPPGTHIEADRIVTGPYLRDARYEISGGAKRFLR